MTSITLPPAPPRCPVAVPCLLVAGSTLGNFLAVLNNALYMLCHYHPPPLPIARNISLTFIAVFADVSINNKQFSSAYDCASYVCGNVIINVLHIPHNALHHTPPFVC